MEPTFDLLTIALLPGVRARTVRELCQRARLAAVCAHPGEHADLLSGEARARLASGRARRDAEGQLSRAARLGVRVVGRDDPDYPAHLRQVYDPPAVLWVQGTLAADEGPRSLAIVGSRACTPGGAALARSMAAELAAAGATIVSGLARGIDTAAHRGAVEVSGRSVAVLGSSLDCLYPRENAGLARQLLERGAVVSEFPLGTSARPHHFPQRNRLLAGWGSAVVVVEASARSGALSTARHALDAGREVLAVPGAPSCPGAEGTNALLRDGARLVRCAADVAADLGWQLRPVAGPAAAAGDAVLEALRSDAPLSADEIGSRLGWAMPRLLARLGALEVESKVRRLPGSLYVRAS